MLTSGILINLENRLDNLPEKKNIAKFKSCPKLCKNCQINVFKVVNPELGCQVQA